MLRSVLTATGVAAVLAVAFYAGTATYGWNAEFTHQEVIDVYGKCSTGEFIGQCNKCKVCQRDEYDVGGCTYFRDTFCALCTPMRHCQQQYTECTSKHDSVCTKCDRGFWGERCQRCTVCPKGSYQTHKCIQDRDTVCEMCNPCAPGTYLAKACSAKANTECKPCTTCKRGTFEKRKCDTLKSLPAGGGFYELVASNPDVVYKEGKDRKCDKCTVCHGNKQFKHTKELCTRKTDTKCETCKPCKQGEYISKFCEAGHPLKRGKNTQCTKCTPRKKGEWTVHPCDPKAMADAIHQKCSRCLPGEYEHSACAPTHDTVCPVCKKIKNCKEGMERCTEGRHSVCHQCEDGWYGKQCCYKKTFGKCGPEAARERAPHHLGFRGKNHQHYVKFCLQLCEEFPDCWAMQVFDEGKDFTATGKEFTTGRGARCKFMAAPTEPSLEDPESDCYSNVCRQGKMYPKAFYILTDEGKKIFPPFPKAPAAKPQKK